VSKLFLLLLIPIYSFATLGGNGDFQIWARVDFVKHFNREWQIKVVQEERWGDSASFLYQVHLQAQTVYTPLSWMRLSPGYRQAWRRTEMTAWHPLYIPFFDFTWQTKVFGCDIKDRNRIEYTVGNAPALPWAYRNRFRVILPPLVSRGQARVAPFVDNEFFWRQGESINQDRICAGLMALLQENTGVEIFYMARFLKGQVSWIYNNIVEAVILFSF
jgi:hypothetical protein